MHAPSPSFEGIMIPEDIDVPPDSVPRGQPVA